MNPSSATTSINQIPALVTEIMKNSTLFPPYPFTQPTIFDFGAGKKGKLDSFFKERKIGYLPYDPFNRSNKCNFDSIVDINYAKFSICCNVLNVIEDDYLNAVVEKLAKLASKTKTGVCLVSVYYKSSLAKNRLVNGHFQRNEPLSWYIPYLEKHFSKITKQSKYLVCFA